MKFFIVLSLFVIAASAGTFPGLLPRLPLMPASFSNEVDGRITNGEEAVLGQFPYQAALQIKVDSNNYFCGGSIIDEMWVLTAAHCVDGADSLVVTLGALYISENEKQQEKLSVTKKDIHIHEAWNPNTLKNDIALVRLSVPLKFNSYIQKAVLPKSGDNFDGKPVVASGWGKDSDSSNTISPVLRFVESTVISISSCNNYYFGAAGDGNICMSGRGGKSTCNGDSGGPLVVKESNKNIVIGATSFGIALGCEVGFPGVFTDVARFAEWIAKISGVRSA